MWRFRLRSVSVALAVGAIIRTSAATASPERRPALGTSLVRRAKFAAPEAASVLLQKNVANASKEAHASNESPASTSEGAEDVPPASNASHASSVSNEVGVDHMEGKKWIEKDARGWKNCGTVLSARCNVSSWEIAKDECALQKDCQAVTWSGTEGFLDAYPDIPLPNCMWFYSGNLTDPSTCSYREGRGWKAAWKHEEGKKARLDHHYEKGAAASSLPSRFTIVVAAVCAAATWALA